MRHNHMHNREIAMCALLSRCVQAVLCVPVVTQRSDCCRAAFVCKHESNKKPWSLHSLGWMPHRCKNLVECERVHFFVCDTVERKGKGEGA
jgi:hypothetical protein